MRSKSLTWTGVIVLIVGIALIFLRSTAIDIIVMVLGAMFLLAAAINLYFIFSSTRVTVGDDGKKLTRTGISVGSVLTAIAAAALGLWMLLDPATLSSMMVYVLAGVLIIAGVYHICLLAFGFRPVKFPFIFYVLPILLAATGIVVLIIGADATKNYIVLITGIAMVAYSVCCFLEVAGSSSFYSQKQLTE